MVSQELLEPQVDQTYRVVHTRKGTFEGKVISLDSEWVDLEITKGIAKGMSSDLVLGERVGIRRSFASFYATGTGL